MFPQGFTCLVVLFDIHSALIFAYRSLTLCGSPSHAIRLTIAKFVYIGLFPVRSPLLGKSMFLSFPTGT